MDYCKAVHKIHVDDNFGDPNLVKNANMLIYHKVQEMLDDQMVLSNGDRDNIDEKRIKLLEWAKKGRVPLKHRNKKAFGKTVWRVVGKTTWYTCSNGFDWSFTYHWEVLHDMFEDAIEDWPLRKDTFLEYLKESLLADKEMLERYIWKLKLAEGTDKLQFFNLHLVHSVGVDCWMGILMLKGDMKMTFKSSNFAIRAEGWNCKNSFTIPE
jgi:hypothetical protein